MAKSPVKIPVVNMTAGTVVRNVAITGLAILATGYLMNKGRNLPFVSGFIRDAREGFDA